MVSQNQNQVANLIGSNAYYCIVQSLSFGLCYGELDSTWYYSLEHISLGFSASLSSCLEVSTESLVTHAYLIVHVRQHKERPAKSKRFLLALIVFMFLVDTGLFISNIGSVLALFHWAGDTITDTTPWGLFVDSWWCSSFIWYMFNSFWNCECEFPSESLKPESSPVHHWWWHCPVACNCSVATFLLDQSWSLFSIFGRYRHALQRCIYVFTN